MTLQRFLYLIGMLVFFTPWASAAGVYNIPFSDQLNQKLDWTAYKISADKKKEPINLTVIKTQYFWQQLDSDKKIIKIKVEFILPVENFTSFGTEQENLDIQKSEDHFLLRTNGLTNSFFLLNNKKEKTIFQLQANMKNWPLLQEGCQELGLGFKSEQTQRPIFVGAQCFQKDSKYYLQISFPEEAQLLSSSIVETQGKGESYRVYELGNLDAAEGSVGKFVLSLNKKDLTLELFSQKTDALKKNPIVQAKFLAGLGYGSLNFQGAGITAKESKPFFVLSALPYFLFWKIGAGIDLTSAFGSTDQSKTISLFQVEPYSYIRLVNSNSFVFETRAYYSMFTQSNAENSASYQLNVISLGARAGIRMNGDWWGNVEAKTASSFSKSMSSHYFLDFKYLKRPQKNQSNYGLGLQLQSMKIKQSETIEYQFANNLLYVAVVF